MNKHTPTPWTEKTLRLLPGVDGRINLNDADFIVRAVNAHEELLEAAKNARNVLAALVTGDLKDVKADSPALTSLRAAIAKAEGK